MKYTYEAPQAEEIRLWIENDAMVANSSTNKIGPADEDDSYDF